MLLDLLNLLVGFILILLAGLILSRYFRHPKINFFFLLLLLLFGFSRFQYGLDAIGIFNGARPNAHRVLFLLFLLPPVYYLCLKTFFFGRVQLKEIFVHILIFLLFLVPVEHYWPIDLTLLGFLFLGYSMMYYALLIGSSIHFFRTHQTIYSKQQLIKVRNLMLWLVVLSLSGFLSTIYHITYFSSDQVYVKVGVFQTTVLVWVGFLIYLFFNPSVIFNEVFKKKDPERNFIHEFVIWHTKPIVRIKPQDVHLETKLRRNMDAMILDLRNFEPEFLVHASPSMLINEMAKYMPYPKSHIKFAFKYFCAYSLNDYLNLMRVIYALELANEGYLEQYTIESLADKCHFNSRTSFYRHFKKHIGVSPAKYKSLME